MLINKATLTAVFLGLKTTFNDALKSGGTEYKDITETITSTTAENVYQWVDEFPKMREWIGEKRIKALKAHEMTIKNKSYECTISVKRDDIEDDQLGMYSRQAKGAGVASRDWPADIVYDLVNGSFAATCYDGKTFIATDHPVMNPKTGKEVGVSNKLTVKLDASTQAAAIASLGAARTAMMEFKDDEGRPLALNPAILLVPPALEATARILLNNEKLEDGKPNPYRGTFKLKVEPRLTSTSAWFVIDNTQPMNPFIFQERKKPVFVSQTDLNAEDVFNKGEYKFGAEARGNGGYGFWQMVVGSTGANAPT